MKWIFKRPKTIKPPGLVGLQITPQGIAMAYCLCLSGQVKPSIKALAFKEAATLTEKTEALRQFVLENHLEQVECNFVLNYKEYRLALVDAPVVPQEEINQALQWLAREAIDFPIEEAVLDSFEVPLPRARDSHKVCYLTAVQRLVIPPIKTLVTQAGLVLKSIDVPELILRNLAFQQPSDTKGQLVVQLIPTGGRLLVCREGNIYLIRNLDLNLESLLKGQPSENTEGILEEVALEIQRSLDFCQGYFRQPVAQSILLLPTQLNIDLLQQTLHSALGLEIQALDMAHHLAFEPSISTSDQINSLMAIGAALREVGKEEVPIRDTTSQFISASN